VRPTVGGGLSSKWFTSLGLPIWLPSQPIKSQVSLSRERLANMGGSGSRGFHDCDHGLENRPEKEINWLQ